MASSSDWSNNHHVQQLPSTDHSNYCPHQTTPVYHTPFPYIGEAKQPIDFQFRHTYLRIMVQPSEPIHFALQQFIRIMDANTTFRFIHDGVEVDGFADAKHFINSDNCPAWKIIAYTTVKPNNTNETWQRS